MSERLTERQRRVLSFAVECNGIIKSNFPRSSYWRNFDQLERRGLLDRRGGYIYYATDRAKAALSVKEE